MSVTDMHADHDANGGHSISQPAQREGSPVSVPLVTSVGIQSGESIATPGTTQSAGTWPWATETHVVLFPLASPLPATHSRIQKLSGPIGSVTLGSVAVTQAVIGEGVGAAVPTAVPDTGYI